MSECYVAFLACCWVATVACAFNWTCRCCRGACVFFGAVRDSVPIAAAVQLLHLAARSASALESLLKDAPLDFGYRAAGKLMITGSAQTLAGLQRRADLKRQHGVRVDIVDAKESLAIEPALEAWRSRIAGAPMPETTAPAMPRRSHAACAIT